MFHNPRTQHAQQTLVLPSNLPSRKDLFRPDMTLRGYKALSHTQDILFGCHIV
jgi:hypothetical protein